MLRNSRILHDKSVLILQPQIIFYKFPNSVQSTDHKYKFKYKPSYMNIHSFNQNNFFKCKHFGAFDLKIYNGFENRIVNKNLNSCIVSYSTNSNKNDEDLKLEKEICSESSFKNIPKIIDSFRDKIDPYLKLMRVHAPIGTWLLFWPGAWSIVLASSPAVCSLSTTAHTLALFLTGALVMRGAGCTINDMWDKDIDAKVERTKSRPLVNGKITQKQALVFLAGQLSLGLSVLLQLNWYSVILGASSMVLVVVYPLAKRVTYYPQLVLGLCFNWGAMLGWTAIQGSVSPACLALYAAGVSWTLFYDTIYAHQDKRDDAIIGVKSTALKFGDSTKSYLTVFATSLVASLSTAGVLCDLDWPYYILIGGVGMHTAKQVYSLDMDNPKDCADKFVSNHRVGLLIFLGILLGKWKTWVEYLGSKEAIEKLKSLEQINALV